MRHALAIGGLIFICVIVIPGFWLARKSKAALSPGILSAQVDKLASRWDADNVPQSDRVVNLVISDARAASAAENKPEERSSAYTSEDLEVLGSSQRPSLMARVFAWFRRTFLRRSMSAGEDTVLAEAFSNKPNAATWTHKGEETAGEEEMFGEIRRAVLKAADAGARINIITEGASAVAALKAIKLLKNEKRPNGGAPRVSEVIAVNMNRATLRGLDLEFFSDFSYPDIAGETVFIWNLPVDPKKTTVELFSPKYSGKRFAGAELFPMMGGNGDGAQNVGRLIEAMTEKNYTAERVLGYLTAKAEEKKQLEAATKQTWTAQAVSRDLMGRTYEKKEPEQTQPADSLSAIGGGWLKEESGKAATRPAASSGEECPVQKDAWRRKGNADNCRKGYCSWYDAMKSCNGRLPSVKQLQAVYQSRCSGAGGPDCGELYWSSEPGEDGPCYVQGVNFGAGGTPCKMARINGGGHFICR